MKNTLHMDSFYISKALLEEARSNPDIQITGKLEAVPFDRKGNVPWLGTPRLEYGIHENLR